MNGLDRKLASALREAAAGYAPSDAAGARERFLRRRLRRRAFRVTAAAALAGAAVVAAALVVAHEPSRRRELPMQSVPQAPPGPTVVTATADVGPAPSDVAVTTAGTGKGGWCITCRAVAYVARAEGADILVVPDGARPVGHISPATGLAPGVIAVADDVLFGASPIGETLERFVLTAAGPGAEPSARARVGAQPTDVVYGDGYVWVASSAPDGSADSYVVTKLDAVTLERVSTIPVPGIAHLDFGYGRLWAGTTQGVVAIDPRSDERTRVPGVGSVSDVSAGAGALWAFEQPSNGLEGTLARIDPDAADVVERVPVRGFFARVEADEVNGIWVLASLTERERELLRIDPRSGRRMGEPLALEGGVMQMTSGAGALWLVDDAQGTLRRVEVERD